MPGVRIGDSDDCHAIAGIEEVGGVWTRRTAGGEREYMMCGEKGCDSRREIFFRGTHKTRLCAAMSVSDPVYLLPPGAAAPIERMNVCMP